jgi:phosphatidylglycerol---prolipoprotein diacylglyceryl transferase
VEDLLLPSVCYALAYLTGIAAFAWMARRRGMRSGAVWTLMQAGLVGGLLGANLAQLTLGGAAGKTVLGGVAGGYVTVAVAKWVIGFRRPTGDLFAVALCAGEAVGRFGCFFGGCCYGKECAAPWAVWQHGAWRHPTQLYLSVACLGILASMAWYARSRPPENGLFYLQGLLYCGTRFVVEFYRDSHAAWVGLTTAQFACLVGGLYFGIRLALQRRGAVSAVITPPPVLTAGEHG